MPTFGRPLQNGKSSCVRKLDQEQIGDLVDRAAVSSESQLSENGAIDLASDVVIAFTLSGRRRSRKVPGASCRITLNASCLDNLASLATMATRLRISGSRFTSTPP
jgi:hypothetical protein